MFPMLSRKRETTRVTQADDSPTSVSPSLESKNVPGSLNPQPMDSLELNTNGVLSNFSLLIVRTLKKNSDSKGMIGTAEQTTFKHIQL